jgi:hypothetical protein
MPIHDWTRVDPGIFHHFHHTWITEIQRGLNRGVLPSGYYALAEQIAGGLGPDVLALERPSTNSAPSPGMGRGVAVAEVPPQVEFHQRTEADQYADKANAVVIRHKSEHVIIAVIEVVSPGNKNSRHGIRSFVRKAEELLRAGVHLLVIDLFPPGPRDPNGIHQLIWEEMADDSFVLPAARRLTLASYIGKPALEAFVQPMAVGQPLHPMPLFLTPQLYVLVPLEAMYEAAWADVPAFYRDILSAPPTS